MGTYLILVAGGTGSRMGSRIPKQFLELLGKPVVCHSIEIFQKEIQELKIILAVHSDWITFLKTALSKHFPENNFSIVAGGDTRFHSVKNGLEIIPHETDSIVMIHDAARPMISAKTIQRCIASARLFGTAIPVMPIAESLREVKGENSVAVNRDCMRSVQTPQCFNVNLIKKAFEQEWQPEFTDDASVAEAAGNKIHLVEGNRENIKITVPQDLEFAEFLLLKKSSGKN